MGDFWNKRKRGDAMWEKVENGGKERETKSSHLLRGGGAIELK